MATIPKAPTTDFSSTTLNGSIDASVTTITVNSASAIQVPTYAVIDRQDANGNNTPNAREVVYISAKNSNDLTVTRGVNNSTARAHNDAAKLEPIFTVGMYADLYTVVTQMHDTTGNIVTTGTASIARMESAALALLSTASINHLQVRTLVSASGASVVGFDNRGVTYKYKARAFRSGNQTDLTDTTWVKVQLNAESYDPNSNFDSSTNYVYTVPVTGFYDIFGAIKFVGSSVIADKVYGIRIVKNGSTEVANGFYQASLAGGDFTITVDSRQTSLTAGDTVQMDAIAYAGANTVDVEGGTQYTYMYIKLVEV